jgi:hypothetical protein
VKISYSEDLLLLIVHSVSIHLSVTGLDFKEQFIPGPLFPIEQVKKALDN